METVALEEGAFSEAESLSDVDLLYDIEQYANTISDKNSTKRKILYYSLFYQMSDSEISDELYLSRQYVNRVKTKLIREFKDKIACA